jgi:hypothetical protein
MPHIYPAEPIDWRLVPNTVSSILEPLRAALPSKCASGVACCHASYAGRALELLPGVEVQWRRASQRGGVTVRVPIFCWSLWDATFTSSHEVVHEVLWAHVAALECALERGEHAAAYAFATKVLELAGGASESGFMDLEHAPEEFGRTTAFCEVHYLFGLLHCVLFGRGGLLVGGPPNAPLFCVAVDLMKRLAARTAQFEAQLPRMSWLPLKWGSTEYDARGWQDVLDRRLRYYRVLGHAAEAVQAQAEAGVLLSRGGANEATVTTARTKKGTAAALVAYLCRRVLIKKEDAVERAAASLVFTSETEKVLVQLTTAADRADVPYDDGAIGEEVFVRPVPTLDIAGLESVADLVAALKRCFDVGVNKLCTHA